MRSIGRFGIFIGVIAGLLLSSSGHAEELHNALSLQGYTGLLNTPNAEVTQNGRLYMLFSDQVEPYRRHLQDSAENYLFSIGFLPYFEIGGRFTEEHPDGIRDLSANAKVQIPLPFESRYFPDIALGIQDIGGGSTHFETKYLVFSKEIAPLRLSFGYGTGPDRLDGIFGGAEVRVFDWLYLLAEHDTDEENLGIRLLTPHIFGYPAQLGLTAKTSLDHEPGELDLAVSLQIPLGYSQRDEDMLDDGESISSAGYEPVAPSRQMWDRSPADGDGEESDMGTAADRIVRLKDFLVKLGFENVRAGIVGEDTLYIEYENNRYNHNELDGLGLVMGFAARMAPEEMGRMMVVLKKRSIPMIKVEVPVEQARDFLLAERVGSGQKKTFSEALAISADASSGVEDVLFIGDKLNSSRFIPRIALYPGLRTFLGTEISAFDYLVSLKPDAWVHLWYGGVLAARWDIPIFWSENFDDGEPWEPYRDDAKLERVMLHQAVKISPDLMTQFSVGQYLEDNTGVMNQTFWSPGNGRHRLGLRLGYFEDDATDLEREIWLGSYRFYWERLDLFLEGTYGQYWYQDKGVTLEMKRFFGDTAITFFYRHIGTDTGERSGGIRITLPLTPRKDMKPKYVQVTGSDHWTYEHQTAIAEEGERNIINPEIAVIPRELHGLEWVYYNEDRLNERYIRQHLLRLREAYLKLKGF